MNTNWMRIKVREGSDVRGKPKIYISYCESASDKGFLGELISEILEFQDCAVYYGTGEATEADRSAAVSDMNIMVALISKDAANKESVVYREIEMAKRFMIPVFPVVAESISPEDINAVFGNLQYLYRETVFKSGSIFSERVAAVTYKEKLKEYLQYILVDKELHERVKKEFAGKIFLSYRKKDYRWVSNIGAIIVNDERFRDTAVWYDDYLIYGEQFDKSIENALSECDVFVLAITKNMVNEENYVTSVEYPMAKKLRKHILPIILEDVEQDKIEEKFPELGAVTEIKRREYIYEKLIKMLKGYDTRKLNNSPEHIYLIGLAHYYGINVPKRRDEGLSIIKQAAERGSVEALRMVARILRFGFDKSEAVKWQKKTVDTIEKLHYNKEQLFEEKLKLSELYREYNAETEFAEALKELIKKFKCQLEQKGIYESSLLELGKFLMNSGDFEESRTCFDAVIKAYKGANSKAYELAEAYRLLANIYIDEHEFSRAVKLLEKAGTIFKERDSESISEERIRVCVDFEKLYETARKADIFVERKSEYVSTCELKAQVRNMKSSDAYRIYRLLGECEMSLLPESAAGYFKKALERLSKYDYLSKEVYKEKEAELCVLTAEAYERAKNYREAENYYHYAMNCYIIEGENAVRYCNGYINCRNKLARLCYKMKNYQKSDKTFEFPIRGYSSINLDRPKAHVLEDVSLYITKGCCYEALKDYFRAEEIYRLAAKTILEAMEKFSSAGLKGLLIEVYARLGTIYGEREDCNSYHVYFKRAIKLCKQEKSYVYGDTTEAVYRHYADALAKDSKYLRALYFYRKAMKTGFVAVFTEITGTVIYSKTAGVFADMKMLPVAVRFLKKAEKLWSDFREYEKKERKSGEFPFEVPPTYYRKGLGEQSPADELKKAKEHIEKALKLKQEKYGKG